MHHTNGDALGQEGAMLGKHVHLEWVRNVCKFFQTFCVSDRIHRVRLEQLESDEQSCATVIPRRRRHTSCESQNTEVANELHALQMTVRLLVY